MVASSFWDMRLSIACAATDAEYQNRIILHDNTLNLPAVAQQPHLDPNYALLHFPSLFSANTPTLKANSQLCMSLAIHNYAPHSAARRIAAA